MNYIRKYLNRICYILGGHIGCVIKKEYRGKGIGKMMLKYAFSIYKNELKINKILITCADSNIASIKCIEGVGGKLEDRIDWMGKIVRRYWVEL